MKDVILIAGIPAGVELEDWELTPAQSVLLSEPLTRFVSARGEMAALAGMALAGSCDEMMRFVGVRVAEDGRLSLVVAPLSPPPAETATAAEPPPPEPSP